MRYVIARHKDRQRELAYRIYVTDSLRIIGGLNLRWYEAVEAVEDKPKGNQKSASEVVSRFKNKFRS